VAVDPAQPGGRVPGDLGAAAPAAGRRAAPGPSGVRRAAGAGVNEPTLGDRFRRLIAATGPISLAHYMAESNACYYTSRDPLGAAGDFVTAPEISQMFGELIGLWLADAWRRAGG